jgi:hypothetical protein
MSRVEIVDRVLTPAQVELWVRARVDAPGPGLDLRGRLMGPRCRYADTVEVAYPLRPLVRPGDANPAPDELVRRVVIPEASLWEPESPFLYEGPVELWQEGARCQSQTVRHGLCQVQLGPRGLRVNSRPLVLRGVRLPSPAVSEGDLLALRARGFNLLVVSVSTASPSLWDLADDLGFFVLGEVEPDGEAAVEGLARHVSTLGWVLSGAADGSLTGGPGRARLGMACTGPLPGPLPSEVSFAVGRLEVAGAVGLPWLLEGSADTLAPGCIGMITPG